MHLTSKLISKIDSSGVRFPNNKTNVISQVFIVITGCFSPDKESGEKHPVVTINKLNCLKMHIKQCWQHEKIITRIFCFDKS